jgi:hypothetical protein
MALQRHAIAPRPAAEIRRRVYALVLAIDGRRPIATSVIRSAMRNGVPATAAPATAAVSTGRILAK